MLAQAISCNTLDSDTAGATEMAMIKLMKEFKGEVDMEGIQKKYLNKDTTRFQFSSKRKKMSTILANIEDSETGYPYRIHLKGAAEIVLRSCKYYIDAHGQKQELKDADMNKLESQILDYADKALRTICFAYKDLRENEGGPKHDQRHEDGIQYEVEASGMTLLCLIGIRDVIRQEVKGAVARCRKAHIRVRMVTGDNKRTAIAIAKECTILPENFKDSENDEVLNGPDFYERVGGLICKNCKGGIPLKCKCDKKD